MLKKYLIPAVLLSFILIVFIIYKVTMISNALTQEFKYHVNIGYPNEYQSVYEVEHSYFMNQKGEPLLHFGGWTAAGNEWGSASQNTLLSAVNPLPAGVKVRWFSMAENQFWEGEYRFDREQLAKLFETETWDVIDQERLTYDFSAFYVYVVPGGLVTIWLSGAGQLKLLAQFQAQKTDMDWQEFDQYTLDSPMKHTRAKFVSDTISSRDTPESTREEIRTGTLPVDSARWKRRMWTYSWVLTVSEPFKVKDYLGWYINGERYYTYADTAAQNIFRPMPYFFSVYIEQPDKTLERFDIELKEAEVMVAFKKLSGSLGGLEKTEVYFELSEDRQNGAVYLRNQQEKIQLTADISLQDLYNDTYKKS